MLLVATQIRDPGLEFTEPNDLITTILRCQLGFAERANTLSNHLGIAPTITMFEASHDLPSMGIEASMYDICHGVYNIRSVYKEQSH